MMKIVFITNRLPFPNTDGRKNLLSQYIQQIKEIHPDSEIINISFVDEIKYLREKPYTINQMICIDPPKLAEKLYNIFVNSLLLRKWPLQVAVYYSRKNHRLIDEIIRKEEPAYVIYDMVRVAEYRSDFPARTVLSYDDLLSLRYQRQLRWFKYIPSVFGGFASKLPQILRGAAELKFIQKALIRIESHLLEKYERSVAKRFDHLVFTSPKEAEQFKQIVQHESCHGIPMKFDPDQSGQARPRSYDPYKIVFVGKMDIPHNCSAVVYFCEHIWPKVKEREPKARFYIVGKNPTRQVTQLGRQYPDVFVTGEVNDVKQTVMDSALMIAPLLFGTGIKTKIVEAMSWGIPVVTNAIGGEGINASHRKELFISENDQDMVQNILLLLHNADLNQKISKNSINYVSQHFSSAVTKQKLRLILI
ncbi:Glycosyltransferase involved in cell wall bisynthesis [Paenibacillus tianmuensis]|uniref:Glycosyltransferase involved in cell wall bisynthesis n=1 Tax=Paenibacillus tianmuensis TaxID=624147 RepID=A0A1G4R5H2_9BACL|nr:glycosyltransferase [Paenibacillus tianmuensis]SCW52123.1 Glycosyltransferase involved in cell wall bisynthesis [Paenibacillus tianmuensis]